MHLRGHLPDHHSDVSGLRDRAADALRRGRGVPGRASGPRRHRVAQPGEMTNDAPGADGMTGNTQSGCEHPEPECILEPGCRCPHCLMMEGYLIAMRRVAAL